MRRLRALLVLALLGAAGPAQAKATVSLPWPPEEIWSTAIRLLRVDLGYTIREKDADSGYVLFELTEGPRKYKGSLELVRTRNGDGRVETQAVVTLPDLPRHYEALLADKLTAKVKDELGSAPPSPRKRPEDSKRPDAGTRREP